MSQRPGLVGGQSYSRSVENGTRPSAHPPACSTACLVSLCHLHAGAHAASQKQDEPAFSAGQLSMRTDGDRRLGALTGLALLRAKVAE